MPLRDEAPIGAPCWVDVLTSDPARTQEFYGHLFGWTVEDPGEEYGGYFNFQKDGVHVAGGMRNDGESGVPGLHRGFGVMGEPGTPAWFELHTRTYDASVDFYRSVFGWKTQVASDEPDFRYTTMDGGDDQLAGVMDATAFLPDGAPPSWMVYFAISDADATLSEIVALGGAVVIAAEDSPYGRLATAADATGARFRIVAG